MRRRWAPHTQRGGKEGQSPVPQVSGGLRICFSGLTLCFSSCYLANLFEASTIPYHLSTHQVPGVPLSRALYTCRSISAWGRLLPFTHSQAPTPPSDTPSFPAVRRHPHFSLSTRTASGRAVTAYQGPDTFPELVSFIHSGECKVSGAGGTAPISYNPGAL